MERQSEDKPGWYCCQLGKMLRGVEAGSGELMAGLLGSQVVEAKSQGGDGGRSSAGPCLQGQWQLSTKSVHPGSRLQTRLSGSCHINSRSFKERDTNWGEEFLKSILA